MCLLCVHGPRFLFNHCSVFIPRCARLKPLQFGRLTFFIAGAICFSGIVNSMLVMRKGIPYMVCVGVLFMLAGGISMLACTLIFKLHVLIIMIPMTLFSIGAGFTFINAFAGAFHSFPQMAGTAGALYSSMQDSSSAAASALIAAYKGYGQYSLASIILMLSIGSVAAWYCLAFQEESA